MRLVENAKLLSLIKSKKYGELYEKLHYPSFQNNTSRNNIFVCYYMYDMLCSSCSVEKREKARQEIINLLNCLEEPYAKSALSYLLEDPNYSKLWLEDVFSNHKLCLFLAGDKEKYIKAFLEKVFEAEPIFKLYNSELTTDKERLFIKQNLIKVLNKNDFMILDFVRLQQKYNIEILKMQQIENIVISKGNPERMYNLMGYYGCNKRRMVLELGKIKDQGLQNMNFFLEAVKTYYPNILRSVSLGDITDQIMQYGLPFEMLNKFAGRTGIAIANVAAKEKSKELLKENPNNNDDKADIGQNFEQNIVFLDDTKPASREFSDDELKNNQYLKVMREFDAKK